jgi:aspartyl-tRNA(Asn)/glutamyl-tRNA(Gln) amidotransferase subunit B
VDSLPDVANVIRKGNEKPVMRLVGEVMKRSKGRADPKKARKILLDILGR